MIKESLLPFETIYETNLLMERETMNDEKDVASGLMILGFTLLPVVLYNLSRFL